MSKIFIVRNTETRWCGDNEQVIHNEKAFLTHDKAEQFISDYEESMRAWRRKDELISKWKRTEKFYPQPKKDTAFHTMRESLYKAKSLISLDVDSQIQALNEKIKEVDERHKTAILEYERMRLAKKEEFALTLSEEDRAIFMNDNISKPEEKDYDIEELELEE